MSSSKRLAVAFDLGTTTIAASLLDTATGERLAVAGALNPQRPWGADVLSRLDAAQEPERLAAMKSALAREMERLAEELVSRAGATVGEISQVAVAGNPAMEHIALGLPVASLAYPPFRPLFSEGKNATTHDLGWSRGLPAYLFPLPGGFVGGDLVAFLFGLKEKGDIIPISAGNRYYVPLFRAASLYLDLGTNAEIALFDGERFLATSAAAGPAFEGGNLRCGMAALPGAVSHLSIEGDRLKIETIGGVPPRGICGSGVLETVASLIDAGVVDATGRLLPAGEIASNLGNRVQEVNGVPAFVLHRDAARLVYLDQEDIRALQLAKAAMRAGMEILLSRAGLTFQALSKVVLTGSFGAVLSPEVLKKVGVFTENMVRNSGFVREGALAGVERLLIEPDGLSRLESLARQVQVIPLSGTPRFEKLFLHNIDFPKS